MKTLLRRALLLGGLAAVAGLAYLMLGPRLHGSAREQDKTPPPASAVAVTVTPATQRSVERRVAVVGTLEGHDEVSLAAKIDGRVRRIHQDVGDEVAPGTLLLEIDDTDHRLAVVEAQRGLDLELSRLGLKELPADGKPDFARVPSILRARNLEDNAKNVLDRARRLGIGRVIAAEEMDRAQTEYRVAQANREAAEMEALSTVAAARLRLALLDIARQKLADTRLLAPCPSPARLPPGVRDASAIRYVVAARKVAEGDMAKASPPTILFRLLIDNPLKLIATVPEQYQDEVRIGQPVAIRVESYPERDFAGKVARIHPTVDRVNRTFTVEVHVPNDARLLRAGSFVKANILTRTADRALTIPEEAILRFAGVVKVFTIHADRAVAVPVRVGESILVPRGTRTTRWVEVEGALTAGIPVVTSGHSQLADGTLVRILER